VLTPKVKYTLEQKTTILRVYRERISLRGLQRVFGVWRSTVLRWLKAWVENLPSLHETLLPVQATDVLELDELVSFVADKFFKRWLWLAMCRQSSPSGPFPSLWSQSKTRLQRRFPSGKWRD
jgi:insertion element IS1 protein InsB